MARPRRAKVSEIVQNLLRTSRLREPPVDVAEIARRLGADVRVRELSSDLSGVMHRVKTGAVIGVNSTHALVRQRFTMAHEVGHWLLDHGDAKVDTVRRRDAVSSAGTDPEEVEANQFAAELLMPEHWLKKDLAGRRLGPLDTDELEELAERYEVSLDAMMFRLTNLSLLKA